MLPELMLTPGPGPVPAAVFEAMAESKLHHRSSEFRRRFSATAESYRLLVGSDQLPLFLTCSGSGAMEAGLRNLLNPGQKILVYHAGKFGERFATLAKLLECDVTECSAPWGESPSLQELERLLTEQRFDALAIQYCETSTGVLHPVPKVLNLLKQHQPGALSIVDAITAIGVVPISQRELGVDCLICGSQKALMLPPGLAMLSFSTRAVERITAGAPRSLYFDLKEELKEQSKGSGAWTPAAHLVLGLQQALKMLEAEGQQAVFARHERLSRVASKALESLKLRPFPLGVKAPGLTVFRCPEGVEPSQFRSDLLDKYNLRIAGGQGPIKGSILRVGHMGYVSLEELIEGFCRIASCLGRSRDELHQELSQYSE